MQQRPIYSHEEEAKIADLNERIRPIDRWIREHQNSDPSDEMTDKRAELRRLALELNDILDRKHLKTAQAQ